MAPQDTAGTRGSTPSISGPVGFVGLGNIGAPMATRLLGWPGGLVVHDLDRDATEPLAAGGAEVAADTAELARRCDLVCVMVNTEQQVQAVLDSPGGLLEGAASRAPSAEPLVVAVHSTISPGGAESMAERAAEHGVSLLDVPVSGGAMGAHGGTLALMAGGDPAAFGRCREALSLMGSLVLRFGGPGDGTRAKVARNLISFASFVAVGEASRMAEAAGIDLVALGEVVRHSDSVTGGPGAVMLRDSASTLAPDDPLRPIFEHSAELGEKDLRLAIGMAVDLGVEPETARFALDRLRSSLGVDP